MISCIRIAGELMYLDIKAVPGSSATGLGEIKEARLKVKIAAAPEDGKANAELCAYLAKILGCAKKEAVLKSGEKSRLKTVALPVKLLEKLEGILAPRR